MSLIREQEERIARAARADILRDIRELEATAPVHVATSQGTYGAAEACRTVGTGDPAFADRDEYERIDGTRYATGPDKDRAPGRMRRINDRALAALRETRKRLAALRAELRKWS